MSPPELRPPAAALKKTIPQIPVINGGNRPIRDARKMDVYVKPGARTVLQHVQRTHVVPVLPALDDLYQYDISYFVVKRISSLEGEDKQ